MNTLFEKFKEYALTKEQASQVRGGGACENWSYCQKNAKAAAYETDNGLEPGLEQDLLWRNLHRACNDTFWTDCWDEMFPNG